MNLTASLTDKANALESISACLQSYQAATIISDDCNILIQEQPDYIHLTCRGSKSIEDWLSDFDCRMITVSGGRAHEGDWMSYQNVSSKLRSNLKRLSRKPLVCDGHSRGGGHTNIMAMDLFGEYDIASVISFGGMRWADKQLAGNYDRWLKDKTIRWVNALDPVPHVPSTELGYAHVGHEAYLTSAGGLATDPGEWELTEDGARQAIEDVKNGKPDLFAFHHLENYQARIQALA